MPVRRWLLGANGAGKTTLLKVLATLVRLTRGTAIVAGYDCAKNAELVRREIGLVAHSSHVYEDLTAAENLTFWTTLAGLRPSAADRAASRSRPWSSIAPPASASARSPRA